MKRNPFAVLGFTPALVATLKDMQRPDALEKIAAAHKRYLLAACHPDRVIGGHERAGEISEAYEAIARGEEREELIQSFLHRPAQIDFAGLRSDNRLLQHKVGEVERTMAAEIARLERALQAARIELDSQVLDLTTWFEQTLSVTETEPGRYLLDALPERWVLVVKDTPHSFLGTAHVVQHRQIVRSRDVAFVKRQSVKQPLASGVTEKLLDEIRSGWKNSKRGDYLLGSHREGKNIGHNTARRGEIGNFLRDIVPEAIVGQPIVIGGRLNERRPTDPTFYFTFAGYVVEVCIP